MTVCTGPGRVRRADVDDARAIAQIHVRSWRAAYAGTLPPRLLRRLSVADLEPAWKLRLGAPPRVSHALLVERTSGSPAGFASVGASGDPDADGHTGELQALYLDPDHWRQGLGRILHHCALRQLVRDGYRVATLWVPSSQQAAQRFYAKAGWTRDGTVKTDAIGGYPVEEIRYAKALDDP